MIENEISSEEKNENELKEAEGKRLENNRILKEQTDKIIEERKREDKQKIQDEIIKDEEAEAKRIENNRLIQEKKEKEKEDRIKKEKQAWKDKITKNKELQAQRNTEQAQYREKSMEKHLIEYCEEHNKDYYYCPLCVDPPIMLDMELLSKYDWVISLKDNLFSNITKIKNSFKISKDLYCPQCNHTADITFIKMYYEVRKIQEINSVQNKALINLHESDKNISKKIKELMLIINEVKDHT